jgi:carbon-monoxide dehydrogenase large subunit
LGIKGAGEAGVIPGMAVFAAAIEDAEGFRVDRMPISPSELFALRAAHDRGEVPSVGRGRSDGSAPTSSRPKHTKQKESAR